MTTDRLYYSDAYQTKFRARVVERLHSDDGRIRLVLDRTLFYPTSGGQPFDSGWIDGVPVLDVVEEDDRIIHVLSQSVSGNEVEGHINWDRRFDHMQQHTGQHLLSAVFEMALGARTMSFHLGEAVSTIDLDMPDLRAADVREVEHQVNRVVMENCPVEAKFYEPEELSRLQLRKAPPAKERIRVVTVAGLDHSPCGGTHCRATGEIGLIKARRWQRHREGTRVEFLCGWRALDDYGWKHDAITELANALTIKDREVVDAVFRLQETALADRKAADDLQSELLDYEAKALVGEANGVQGIHVVRRAFDDRDPEQIRRLALRIARLGHVALLGTQTRPGRLFFARSESVPLEMGALLRECCGIYGGGGGGQAHAAQGGGMPPERVAEALEHTYNQILALLDRWSAGGDRE